MPAISLDIARDFHSSITNFVFIQYVLRFGSCARPLGFGSLLRYVCHPVSQVLPYQPLRRCGIRRRFVPCGFSPMLAKCGPSRRSTKPFSGWKLSYPPVAAPRYRWGATEPPAPARAFSGRCVPSPKTGRCNRDRRGFPSLWQPAMPSRHGPEGIPTISCAWLRATHLPA